MNIGFMHISYSYKVYMALAVLFIISLIIALAFIKMSNSKKRMGKTISLFDKIIDIINPEGDLDDNYKELVNVIDSLYIWEACGIYIFNERNNKFNLRAIKHTNMKNIDIEPSYSGLIPYSKEFLMPQLIEAEMVPDNCSIAKEGEVSLLFLPLLNKSAVFVGGPANKISSNKIKKYNESKKIIEKTLGNLLYFEKQRNITTSIVTSRSVVKEIGGMINGIEQISSMIMDLCIKSTEAIGGVLIVKSLAKKNISIIRGFQSLEKIIRQDKEFANVIEAVLGDKDLIILKKGEKDFFQLPVYFSAEDIEAIAILKVQVPDGEYILLFGCAKEYMLGESRIRTLVLLSKRISDLSESMSKLKNFSDTHISTLKLIAQLLDERKPYTINYSELMSRYCGAIAKEMRFTQKDIDDVCIAAYLSNIGVIAISDEIYYKGGKYTGLEYEVMKMHGEIGAEIIDLILFNKDAANYVRYHHECMNGEGYPYGLSGEEIPLGSRIILTVQIFLAKIIGRDYRRPLTFEAAINEIKNLSSSQLDKNVVEAFISWFEKKQKKSIGTDRSLGPCHTMRCSPEYICIKCPAYKQSVKNCWEFENNNCKEHGNECSTCFIYTEMQYRNITLMAQNY